MRKQNAVIILNFDYRYITKVCIHAFLPLKITISSVLNVNKTYKSVLLLSENTSLLTCSCKIRERAQIASVVHRLHARAL